MQGNHQRSLRMDCMRSHDRDRLYSQSSTLSGTVTHICVSEPVSFLALITHCWRFGASNFLNQRRYNSMVISWGNITKQGAKAMHSIWICAEISTFPSHMAWINNLNWHEGLVNIYSTLMVILPMPCWGCRVKPHGMAVPSDAFTHIIPFLFIFSIW